MVESTTFTHDGIRLSALLFRPDGADGPVPAVVVAQGFGNVKEVVLPELGEHLAAAGIATLAFDFGGFGDSGSVGDLRQHVDPTAQLAQYRSALGYVETLDGIDADRLGVCGISLSGGHAMRLAATDDRVRCAVAIVPFVELNSSDASPDLLEAIIADVGARGRGEPFGMIPIVGQPGDLAVLTADGAGDIVLDAAPNLRNEVTLASLIEMAEYKPLAGIEAFAAPVRAILGTADTVNPPTLARAALAPFADVDLVDLPADHFSIFTDHLDETAASTAEWFTRHLL